MGVTAAEAVPNKVEIVMLTLEKSKERKVVQFVLHVLIWSFLFSFPLLFSEEEPAWRRILLRHWLPLFFSALIFYANYFLLVERFLLTKKVGYFILINGALLLFCLLAMDLVRQTLILRPFFSSQSSFRSRGLNRPMGWFRQGPFLLLSVFISVAVRLTMGWYEAESKRKKQENEHLKSELTYLRYQLQPHFFFNTLNNIYALVEQDATLAQQSIHHLGKLMRYLLYESGTPEVPLAKEVAFIRDYVSLMQLRVPDSTDIQTHFPAVPPDRLVAPLLFVSLVENAFKHGLHASLPSFVHLRLHIEENSIRFTVENSNHPKSGEDKSGSGIGLENLKKRLRILYPDQHTLTIRTDAQKYVAELVLNQ